MHIIQVITELEPAGAEKILSELSIELKNKGYTVSVVTLQRLPKDTTIIDKLKRNDIKTFSLTLTKSTPWKIFMLKRLLQRITEKDDYKNTLVHSHLMHANLACRISKFMGLKAKLVNTVHIAEKRKLQKWLFLLDKLTLRYCDAYTAVSSAARDYHSKILGIDQNYIKVITNGIVPPNKPGAEKIANLKKEWGLFSCSKIIGSLGRLNFQKGYDIFLDLLSDLAKMIPKNETCGIVILGEGEERKKLEEKIRNLPDNVTVVLPGFRSDASECAGAFDLFVMPSRYEGMPLTLLEALSHGIPILTSNIDTTSNLIKTYTNGKCINFEDKQIAVQSILEYITKPKISDYKVEYTQGKMVSEYIVLYNEILTSKE
jgi:glycosyltransferase involved in cell wall biosynthesis